MRPINVMTVPQQNIRIAIHREGRIILRMMLLGTSKTKVLVSVSTMCWIQQSLTSNRLYEMKNIVNAMLYLSNGGY